MRDSCRRIGFCPGWIGNKLPRPDAGRLQLARLIPLQYLVRMLRALRLCTLLFLMLANAGALLELGNLAEPGTHEAESLLDADSDHTPSPDEGWAISQSTALLSLAPLLIMQWNSACDQALQGVIQEIPTPPPLAT